MTNIDRATKIIERATRGAHTTDGHLMKMSDHTAQIIAEALADDGLLMPDLPGPAGDAEEIERLWEAVIALGGTRPGDPESAP